MDDKKIIEAVSKWPWTRKVYPVQTASDRARRQITLLTHTDDVSLVTAGMEAHHPFIHVTLELIADAEGDEAGVVQDCEEHLFP